MKRSDHNKSNSTNFYQSMKNTKDQKLFDHLDMTIFIVPYKQKIVHPYQEEGLNEGKHLKNHETEAIHLRSF